MIKTLLKIVFAVGIITWLLKSGRLDFSLLSESFNSGYNWLWCILIFTAQIIFAALRWRIILKIKSTQKLPVIKVFSLTWIGQFFNTFLPGAVTGDLIKLVYARDLDKSLPRTFLVVSALMDRIIGLMGLLFLLGISTLINYKTMMNLSPEIQQIMHFNLFLFSGAIVFVLVLFLPERVQRKLLILSSKIPLIGKKVHKTLLQVWDIGRAKKSMLLCLSISIFTQFLNILAFWIVSSPFYGKEMALSEVFTFIPIGLISIAIPISPSGLGVGHLIFDKLFHFVGIPGGASLFNLFFVCIVFVNLLGFFPYILSGKKHNLKEASEFE